MYKPVDTNSPEFNRWFGQSIITGARGKPIVMYHRTAGDFDVFDTRRGDMGSHFGTKDQAANVMGGNLRTGERTIPVYLRITNPLRLKDVGSFHADAIVDQLYRLHLIDKPDMKRFKDMGENGGVEGRKKANDQIKYILKKKGYDGIVYRNQTEGKGNSYIVFDPNQIKSAWTNTGNFSDENPSITENYKPVDTASPQFRAWFRKSLVVDSDGKPIRAYHGTTSDFQKFTHTKAHLNQKPGGFFFTNDPNYASEYSGLTDLGSNLIPVYLRIENPMSYEQYINIVRYGSLEQPKTLDDISKGWARARTVDMAVLGKQLGYDGVITDKAHEFGSPDVKGTPATYIVFNANQIKSAISNTGNFDPENETITEQKEDHDQLQTINKIVSEYMPVLSRELPRPTIKIVNQKNNMLGQCIWKIKFEPSINRSSSADNTVIEIQKRVTHDEKTLRRIIAHELCHHEDFLLNEKPKFEHEGYRAYLARKKMLRDDGHGSEWRTIAMRFNAKYGANFVTKESDKDFVYSDEEIKPFFVLIEKYYNGQLMWQQASRLSPKAKEYLAQYANGQSTYPNKLFMSTDSVLYRGAPMVKWNGHSVPRTDDVKERLQKLWDEGEDLLPRFASSETTVKEQMEPLMGFLTESKAFRNERMVEKYSTAELSDILFTMLLSLHAIGSTSEVKKYCGNSLAFPRFDHIFLSSTDLANTITSLRHARELLGQSPVDVPVNDVKRYLRDLILARLTPEFSRAFFFRMQTKLRIKNPQLLAIRRSLVDGQPTQGDIARLGVLLYQQLSAYERKVDVLALLQILVDKTTES